MSPRYPAYAVSVFGLIALVSGCAKEPEFSKEQHSPDVRIQAMLTSSATPVLALATGDTIKIGDEVKAFYEARNYSAAWTSPEGILPRGQALVAALQGADAEGLDMAEYHREEIQPLIERAKSDVEQKLPIGDLLGSLDLLMTEAYLRYTTDVLQGTLDPGSVGLDWKVPREDATDAVLLNTIMEGENFESALAELRPQVPFYNQLREALPRYRQVAEAGGWPTIPTGPALSAGDRGPRVAALRQRLIAEGDPVEAPLARSASGDVFDPQLAKAVEHFQDRHGLAEDGAAGEGTIQEMNVPVEDRLRSLRLNLDRWRWLPRELGDHYVMVNVAGFEMAVIKDDKPALTMKVIVGKTGTETPIFRDTIESVVVNPYWNVPTEIAKDEIFPKVAADPSWLERNNYEMVGEGSNRGVRQRPGPTNALGEVKFIFPNDHDVYLHDTPADALFKRDTRAFSHGCIRLEKPRELAYYLFANEGKSRADYDRLRGGAEKWVSLKKKLPVYILYFTAWADEDGSVRFYPDIYHRDAKVTKAEGTRLDGNTLPSPAAAKPKT